MKSAARGMPTSGAEVTNVSVHGFWLLLDGQELFVPFTEFPWFRDVTIRHLTNVERPKPHHLYWPDLDVDLATDSLTHPDRYPLVSNGRPNKRLLQTAPAPRTKAARRANKSAVLRRSA
ncbi:MAG: DUF2442 domain-containing protein [Gemmatimonadales bacterium]